MAPEAFRRSQESRPLGDFLTKLKGLFFPPSKPPVEAVGKSGGEKMIDVSKGTQGMGRVITIRETRGLPVDPAPGAPFWTSVKER